MLHVIPKDGRGKKTWRGGDPEGAATSMGGREEPLEVLAERARGHSADVPWIQPGTPGSVACLCSIRLSNNLENIGNETSLLL